jgi:hypothetical protein
VPKHITSLSTNALRAGPLKAWLRHNAARYKGVISQGRRTLISEPFNSVIIIIICLLGALHFSGIIGTSSKSPTLVWTRNKHPKIPKIIAALFLLTAVIRIIGLLL